jgi:hypothetical protein
VFYHFDLVWLGGEDLRELPLLELKRRLRRLVPRRASSLCYVEHIGRRGSDRFGVVCERPMEGIVGKLAHAPYVVQPSPWLKVLDPVYSQARGRHELFAAASLTPFAERRDPPTEVRPDGSGYGRAPRGRVTPRLRRGFTIAGPSRDDDEDD